MQYSESIFNFFIQFFYFMLVFLLCFLVLYLYISKKILIFIVGSSKNFMGDLTSGRAFDNGCTCFDSEEARCNSFRGKTTDCHCGVC